MTQEGAEMLNNCNILEGKLKLKTQLGRYGRIQGIIIKRILKKQYVRLLRLASSGVLL
jgi:hypothetical protein